MSPERGWKIHWSRKIRLLGNVGKAGREQQPSVELVLREQQLIPKGNVCSCPSANSPVSDGHLKVFQLSVQAGIWGSRVPVSFSS